MASQLAVSIDGASATGKTTLGRRLALAYSGIFLDTGLTYRAAALFLTKSPDRGAVDSGAWLQSLTHEAARFPQRPDERVYLDGIDVTEEIWTRQIDAALAQVSTAQSAREAILAYHERLLADEPVAVAAGRDVAITLLEEATLHVVLTAGLSTRTQRRENQYRSQPDRSTLTKPPSALDEKVLAIAQTLPQAVILDTTTMSPDEVYERVEHELRQRS